MRWSYCTMLYHLRDRLQLPWFDPTIQMSWHTLIRGAGSAFFRAELGATGLADADSSAFVKSWITAASNRFASTVGHKAVRRLSGEAILAVASLRRVYDRTRDSVIGVDVPYGFVHNDVTITDTIDAVFFKDDQSSNRSLRVVTLGQAGHPMFEAMRVSGVRKGLLFSYLREQLDTPKHIPTSLIHLPVGIDADEPLTKVYVDEAKTFLDQSLPHLDLAIPTADCSKCRHCPYSSVCSLSLATIRKPEDAIEIKGKLDAHIAVNVQRRRAR